MRSDELWLWHSGGPLILRLGGAGTPPDTDGPAETANPTTANVLLGSDVMAGQQPQALVPGGTWQSAAPASAEHVLVSCVVAPGFDFADFRLA